MKELLVIMKDMCVSALVDIEKAEAGNKAAAKRLRKFTLEMGNRVGKEFRKESVKE